MSTIILAAFVWSTYLSEGGSFISIDLISVGLASLTLVASLIMYIFTPKRLIAGSLSVYALLLVTVIWLVLESGGVHSPFIALWMLAAAFAGIFGWYVVGPLLFAVIGYAIFTLVVENGSDSAALAATVLSGLLPLGLGMLIWYRQPEYQRGSVETHGPDVSELHKVANQSEIVINAIGDGVLAIDSRGTIRLMNPAAEALIGWSANDAVKLDYRSVLQLGTADGRDLPPSLDPVLQVLNTNQQYRTSDISLLTKSGKRILASVVVSPVGDPGAGIIVTFRDVTKEKAEEREQAEFISTASHEMRTPVASIEGYLGLALNPATAQIDEKARMYIEKAHESTQHLGRLFQDLLDITKAEDGRLTSNPELIDMVKFSRDISAGLKPQADQKSLEIIFKPDTRDTGERQLHPVYYINQDKDHLREVISNLVENAIKYTLQGKVEVDITGDDSEVIISVKDTGIGIPAEDIPHLFQKFYRVDGSDTREIGGTGLGLYLCRRLVESMNGRIWVESIHKQGSTFFVAVPRLTHAEANDLLEQAHQQPSPPPATAQPPQPSGAPQAQVHAAEPQYSPQVQHPAQPQAPQPQAAPPTQPQPQPPTQNPTLSAIEQNPSLYRYRNVPDYPRRPQPPSNPPR